MRRHAILVYDQYLPNQREIVRVLSATGSECFVPESVDEMIDMIGKLKFAILILDIDGHKALTERNVDLTKTPSIILSQEKLGELYPYLGQIGSFTNFLAKNSLGRLEPRDLLVTAAKILYKDIFGVHKYLSWGASSCVYHIRSSASRREYIDAVISFCHNMGIRKSIIKSATLFCEELLMNAIYDAPRDEKGRAIYESIPRTTELRLPPSEATRLEIGSDGERLAISVSDVFGSITREVTLKYLSQCFETKGESVNLGDVGGAGLGLYLSFHCVDNLIINVCPEIKTELIGLIDLGVSVKEQYQRHTSFHYFTTDNTDHKFLLSKNQ